MNAYSALILDDEIDNINLLKILLSQFCKNIVITYTATNINDAINIYLEHMPDIVFLDIQLDNNQTSFNFIEKINNFKAEVIFISSYEEYALKAIKNNALGYLVKPIITTELVDIVNMAVAKLDSKKQKDYLIDIIAIPSMAKIDIIHLKDIVYMEANGRYTIFYLVNGTRIVASRNLGEYEKLLNSRLFFRIHHRFIVNLNMVTNINKVAGNYVELLNNKDLPIARRRLEELNKLLKLK